MHEPAQFTNEDSYEMRFDTAKYELLDGRKFGKFATSNRHKIYIFSDTQRIIYVGVTKQRMATRLRLGWRADGKKGYHGYSFRKALKTARLDVWVPDSWRPDERLDAETIEAEIVFRIRLKTGQWPKYQTEIHFHESDLRHRAAAEHILRRYDLSPITVS